MTWGLCNWGELRWGATSCPNTWDQGVIPGAKQDTRFLAKSNGQTSASSFTDFNTDLGQYGLDHTTVTGHPKLTTDAFELGRPFEHTFVVGVDNTDTGTLFAYGDTVGFDRKLVLASSGVITPTINGSADTNGQITLPSIAATAKQYVICWTSDNSRDTGESAVKSWIYAYNVDDDEIEIVTWDHLGQSWGTSISSLWGDGGASIFSGTAYAVRFGNRFHTSTEIYEDFVSRSPLPAPTGETRVEPIVPDRNSNMGNNAELVGPIESMVAEAVSKADLRTAGPFVNEVYTDPVQYDNTYLPANWNRAMPDDSTYTMQGQFYVWAPIPHTVNKFRARVCLDFATSSDGTIDVACFSQNRIPTIQNFVLNGPPPPVFEQYYSTKQTTAPALGTTTEWITFDIRKIARDEKGGSYFGLAFKVSNGNPWYKVLAWTVDPILDTTAGGVTDEFALKP